MFKNKQTVRQIAFVIVALCILALGYFLFVHKKQSSPPKPAVASVNNAVVITKLDPNIGKYLATPAGLPLYTYGADTTTVSNCTVSCLVTWPAYIDSGPTTGLPTNFATIARADNGKTQFTYKGHPLYTFVHDQPGQINGNSISLFKVATP